MQGIPRRGDALQELVGLGAESATARDALSLLYRLSGGLA